MKISKQFTALAGTCGVLGLAVLLAHQTSLTLSYIDSYSVGVSAAHNIMHKPGKVLAATSGISYYVSLSGDDANTGSLTSPLRHISAAVAKAHAGDAVIVMDGTYDNEGKNNEALQVVDFGSMAGSAGAPITVMAQNRGRAILDGGYSSSTELTLGGTLGGNGVNSTCKSGAYSYFNFHNASYIVVQGFVIQNLCDEAFHANDSANNITIKWNDIGHIAERYICDPGRCPNDAIGRDGIYLNTLDHDFTFDGNVWHDIGRTGGPNNLHFDHAIYSHAQNVNIINNVFYNINKGYAIQFAAGAANTLIANNTFAQSNLVTGEPGQIIFWGSNTGITLRNNIFDHPTGYALYRYQATVSGNIDTNLVYGVSSMIQDPTGFTVGTNRFGTDPLFVNLPNHNFHLQATSPAKDAGVAIAQVATDLDGNSRPQGAAYDIGAYEYFVPSTDTTAPTIPTNLSAVATSYSQVNLSWAASTDNVAVSGYKVYRGGNQIATSTSLAYIDTNVTAGSSYSYTVAAYDAAGNASLQSAPANVNVPTQTQVSIMGYVVNGITAGTATITWITNIPSTGTVWYGTSSTNLNLSSSNNLVGTSHGINLAGLKRNTRYYYKISATSQDGSSSANTSVQNFRTSAK